MLIVRVAGRPFAARTRPRRKAPISAEVAGKETLPVQLGNQSKIRLAAITPIAIPGLVPGIHVDAHGTSPCAEGPRDKPGHDVEGDAIQSVGTML